MKNFMPLYGKCCAGSILAVLVLLGVFVLFRNAWMYYGITPDGGKTGPLHNTLQEEAPVIEAENCRLMQNERVNLTDLASARDGNGDDLTDRLLFFDGEGNSLSGCIKTDTPGVYPLTILAHSPYNGKKSRKDIIVLVDGRVSG